MIPIACDASSVYGFSWATVVPVLHLRPNERVAGPVASLFYNGHDATR